VASLVQVGLAGGKPQITNEEIETIFPYLVDAFDTLLGTRSNSRGQYSMTTAKTDRRISMRELDEQFANGRNDGHSWLETFLHELGHSIESQSGVREAVTSLKRALNPLFKDDFSDQQKANAEDILDQMEEISRDRRPQSWAVVDKNVSDWENASQAVASIAPVPSIKQIAYMSNFDFAGITGTHARLISMAGGDPAPLMEGLVSNEKNKSTTSTNQLNYQQMHWRSI
jgi:hypothetical protein